MGHSLSVYVLDSDGRSIKGTKVRIDIEGFWKGGTLKEYTDNEGHAEFETAADYEPHRKVMIYVKDQSFGPYSIEGGAYTVQLE